LYLLQHILFALDFVLQLLQLRLSLQHTTAHHAGNTVHHTAAQISTVTS
jgi:hypothetical protein